MNFLKLRVDVRIALLYAAFGGVWVFLSDSLLDAWVTDPAAIYRLQTYKGWAFVAASALVIFLLLRRELIHRKITEGKLGETEELYRQLFEHSMDAILLTSPDGGIHAANPAACRMFGRKEEEIKRLGRDKVVDVTDPRLKEGLEERARTGRFHGELTLIRRDGSKFPGEVSTNLFKSRDGRDRTSMIIRDVTERRRIQEALQKGEERYRLISSLASDYMFYSRVDDSGQLQLEWVAGAFEGITGYTLEEYIQHGGWRATVHPDDLEVDDHDMEKLREGRRVITEIRTLTKSGGTRWVKVYAQPVLHPESRQLVGIHGAVQEISERKKAEEALSASEELFRSTFEQAAVGWALTDLDGKFIRVNPAYRNITGFSDEELSRLRFIEISHPDDRERNMQLVQQVKDGETKGFVIEKRYIKKSGEAVWVRNSVAGVLGTDGNLVRLVAVCEEITERKKAEQALQEAQNHLKIVLNNAPIVLLAVDRNGIFTLSEGAGLIQSGLQPGQVVGLSAYDLYGELPITLPDGRNISGDELLERVFAGETVIASTDFGGVHFENRFAPLLDQNGEVNGMVGVSIDVTERKQAEDELQSAQALIEKAFASLSEAILVIDPNGRKVIACNPAIEKIFGYKPEEVIGRSTEFLHVDRDSFEQFGRIGEPALSDKGLFQTEYRMRRKEGGIIFTENSVSTLRDDKGWTSGVVSVVRDITERKQAEEELRLSRDRLTELSRRLAETREAEARAIGRELHDQIGQMLTAMKITLDLAAQQPAEAAAKKIERAQELTAELLNRVSRLSLELRPPMLDDLGLLPALTWRVNHYQEETGLEVDFMHSGVEGTRFPSEIETAAYRIVQEALTNVARHAQATRARLEVRERGGWLEIRIEDDGVTFDVESALAKNRGLAGMRERAQLVGGTFQIESEPGRGTRKLIRLPLPGDET
jgi:PAS domain S-box-containing protein